MIGSLSLFSPGSIPSYGSSASVATPQGLANDGSAVCASLDCGEHGALNKAKLQAQFGGLVGGEQQPSPQQATAKPVSGGASGGLSSGATLLGAQQGTGGSNGSAKGADDLTEEERAQVEKLKKIDAKVRAHERAHAAVGGQYAGAPSYSYTRGPDGQMYATSGEVAIDIGAESDPHATLQKANQVAAAALAPADPSGQDRAVAAAAAKLRLEAQAQIRKQEQAEREAQESEGEGGPTPPGLTPPDPVSGPAASSSGAELAPAAESGPSTGETTAVAGRDGPAARATQAYQAAGQSQPRLSAGEQARNRANDNAAEAFAQIGRLVGLIA